MNSMVEIFHTGEARAWNGELATLPLDKRQVGFLAEYHHLLECNGDGCAELFVYTEGDHKFLYPYMLNPIKRIGETEITDELYDIQSVYGYTGPIASVRDEAFLRRANDAFEAYVRDRHVVAEFVRFNPLLQNQELLPFAENLRTFPDKTFVFRPLDGTVNTLWDSIVPGKKRRCLRNCCKQADESSEVAWGCDTSREVFDAFVALYLKHMEHIGADDYYSHSPAYFEALYEFLQTRGTLVWMRYQGRFTAINCYIHEGATVYYHHSARDVELDAPAYLQSAHFMNGLLHFVGKGFNQCLLGGGRTRDDDDSLLRFKLAFSKETAGLFLGKRIHDPVQYERICELWAREFPHLTEKRGSLVLRYRFEV